MSNCSAAANAKALPAAHRKLTVRTTSKGEPVPWQERPLHTLQSASQIAGVSVASLYRFAKNGSLTLKRLAGRTLVDTKSLIALVDTAEDWIPASRADKARAARVERARAGW